MDKSSKKLKIAMIAPPWLAVPPVGYGGVEYVIYFLIEQLRKLGHRVELFTVGESTTRSNHRHWVYAKGQYKYIHLPFYYSAAIPVTHLLFALDTIKKSADFDIIHDHNKFIGPAVLAHNQDLPPILHTLHDPFVNEEQLKQGIPNDADMYSYLRREKHLFFNCISQAQMHTAPKLLKSRIASVVYNAINLKRYPMVTKKSNYYITIGRIAKTKGQAIAAKLCTEIGAKYKIGGIVSDISTSRQIMLELANPQSLYRTNPDFKYYSDEILPQLIPRQIEYIGAVFGRQKLKLLGHAKAFLFPIEWEEPFGVAVIEALACGTPVVAFRRGSMPEIIEHGVNGFLADTPKQFKAYMQKVDEIDPEICRQTVEKKFSAPKMAEQYVQVYRKVIEATNIR
jgi:glycosyltransferase involved in cell wall biosynthesis